MISAVHSQWTFDVPVVSLCVNREGSWIAAALTDGTARLLPASDEAIAPLTVAMHDGVSLALGRDADDHAFLSGGNDGKFLILDPLTESTTVLAERAGQKIGFVAASPAEPQFRVYSEGTHLHVLNEEGGEAWGKPLSVSGVLGDVSFSPDGTRLVASHAEGLSMWDLGAKKPKEDVLVWQGVHRHVQWARDGQTIFGVTEEGVASFHLGARKETSRQTCGMAPTGLVWSGNHRYLLTTGATQVLCWRVGDDGAVEKTLLKLGAPEGRIVTCVAPHPVDAMVAVGYSDGMVVLAPMDGRMEILILPPSGKAINGLVWNVSGRALFASVESGTLLLFTLGSVKKAALYAR